MMLWRKYWQESEQRFFLTMAVVCGAAFIYTAFEAKIMPGVMYSRHITRYVEYLDWEIFRGPVLGMAELGCLLLGVGGLQRDRNMKTLWLTLALPKERWKFVAVRAVLGMTQVAVLAVMVPVAAWCGSAMAGAAMPMDWAMKFVPLWMVGGCFILCLSMLCSVVVTNEYVALALGYASYIAVVLASRAEALRPYNLHLPSLMSGRDPGYLDPRTLQWQGYPMTLPLEFFLGAIALAGAAMLVTERQDF